MAGQIPVIIELFGDWCPGNLNVDVQFSCETALVNIEGPILREYSKPKKIMKLGPHLASAQIPNFSKFSIYSLANNHIMDFGIDGMLNTVQLLESENGKCVGYYAPPTKAEIVQFTTDESQVIAVIAIAERQFGYATDGKPGYIPFSENIFALIEKVKDLADFVIVSTHGGDEKSLFPSLNRRNLLRRFIDSGADLVWGHHSHVPQGWEFWNEGLICYGMGNFATDPNLISHKGLGQYALTARIDTQRIQDSVFGITHQALIAEKIVVKRLPVQSEASRNYFIQINEIIKSDSLLLKYQDMYSILMAKSFYSKALPMYPLSYWSRYAFWSILSMAKNRGKNKYAVTIQGLRQHFIECESHSDMISHFNNYRKEIMHSDHSLMKRLDRNLNSLRLEL
jgi:hypothetical protein